MALIRGTGADDRLAGTGNDDEIIALDGNDTVWAMGGSDTVSAGAGDDEVYGGVGNDTLYLNTGDNIGYGGAGDDVVYAQGGDDVLGGGDGDDTLYAGDGDNTVYGGAGKDSIVAGDDDNTIFSGEGDDRVFVGDGDNEVGLGAGNDFVSLDDGDNIVYGGGGDDTVEVNGSSGTFYGGQTGADRLVIDGDWDEWDISENSDGSFDFEREGQSFTAYKFDAFAFSDETFSAEDLLAGPQDVISNRFGEVNEEAQSESGAEMLFGDGNLPENYVISENITQGVELGLKLHVRGSTDYRDYLPESGELSEADFGAYAEMEDVRGGPNNGDVDRSDFSFDYSIVTGTNGDGRNLDSFDFKLLVDVDPGTGTEFIEFILRETGDGLTPFYNSDGAGFNDDDGTKPNIAQNSGNYGFDFIRDEVEEFTNEDYDFLDGNFDLILQAFDEDGDLIAQSRINFDVDPPAVG